MEWSKLKNIVLTILVLTNLCLLLFVVQREVQSTRLQQQARANAITFLAERGVSVAEEQVPRSMALLPQTAERNLETEQTIAAALLKGSVEVEAPGGAVYRYSNRNGSVQFHKDGAFSAEFSPGVYPLGDDRVQDCLALLETLEFQGLLLDEQENRLTFRQLWEGYPLFTHQVILVCQADCLTSITGARRLVGQPAEDTSRTTITVSTALIRFLNELNTLGDVCSRIDAIEPGYVATSSLSGPMSLTPVWRITTDTGTYHLDTITGLLTRTPQQGLSSAGGR